MPKWEVDVNSDSMVLSPPTARLALGLSTAESALHIVDGNHNVTEKPGAGYLILGQTDLVHMQFDRNDIRVAGPTDSAVGDLYLQRFGGPIIVHGAEPLDRADVSLTDECGFLVNQIAVEAAERKP